MAWQVEWLTPLKKTLTHVHKMVITCWCGTFEKEVKLVFDAFMEVKSLFFTTSEVKTEAKGSHWGDRTLNRVRLACPVSSSRVQRACAPARPVGHGTGAFGQALEKLRSTRGRSDTVARQVTIDRTC